MRQPPPRRPSYWQISHVGVDAARPSATYRGGTEMAEPLRPLGVRPAGQVIIIGLTNHFLVVTVEAALNKPARERARMFTSGGGFKNRVYQQKFPALVCGHCRWKFLAARCDAKTCSPSCRVMLSRARRRAQSRTHVSVGRWRRWRFSRAAYQDRTGAYPPPTSSFTIKEPCLVIRARPCGLKRPKMPSRTRAG